jgi:hypothetical protein
MPQAPTSELAFKATELIRQKLSNVLAIHLHVLDIFAEQNIRKS